MPGSMSTDELYKELRLVFQEDYFTLDQALKEHGLDTQEVRARVNEIAEKFDEWFRSEVRAFMDRTVNAPYAMAEYFAFSTMEPWEANLLRAWQAQQVPF